MSTITRSTFLSKEIYKDKKIINNQSLKFKKFKVKINKTMQLHAHNYPNLMKGVHDGIFTKHLHRSLGNRLIPPKSKTKVHRQIYLVMPPFTKLQHQTLMDGVIGNNLKTSKK
jgi:hypothetical protein